MRGAIFYQNLLKFFRMTNPVVREVRSRETRETPSRVFRYKSLDTIPRLTGAVIAFFTTNRYVFRSRMYFCNTIADQAHISISSINYCHRIHTLQ